MPSVYKKWSWTLISCTFEIVLLPALILVCLFARVSPHRKINVGIGPEPLINNVHFKQAVLLAGYSCETFIIGKPYYVTADFDILFGRTKPTRVILTLLQIPFAWSVFRYECLYIYFNGASLIRSKLLWRIEPFLYRLAGVKIVVMPYGGDVQVLERSKNPLLKHAYSSDYPSNRHRVARVRRQIDVWSRGADFVVSGCDWVDYMYHWDMLTPGHFVVSVPDSVSGLTMSSDEAPLQVLHAPNHRAIKGTQALLSAVANLIEEGYRIELQLLESRPNSEILSAIRNADVIVDQLVIGWYAMFAVEAMANGRPVICYLREDLVDFYRQSGVIEPSEPPLIHANNSTIEDVLKRVLLDRKSLGSIGLKSHAYVRRYHSLDAGAVRFEKINRHLGLVKSSV